MILGRRTGGPDEDDPVIAGDQQITGFGEVVDCQFLQASASVEGGIPAAVGGDASDRQMALAVALQPAGADQATVALRRDAGPALQAGPERALQDAGAAKAEVDVAIGGETEDQAAGTTAAVLGPADDQQATLGRDQACGDVAQLAVAGQLALAAVAEVVIDLAVVEDAAEQDGAGTVQVTGAGDDDAAAAEDPEPSADVVEVEVASADTADEDGDDDEAEEKGSS